MEGTFDVRTHPSRIVFSFKQKPTTASNPRWQMPSAQPLRADPRHARIWNQFEFAGRIDTCPTNTRWLRISGQSPPESAFMSDEPAATSEVSPPVKELPKQHRPGSEFKGFESRLITAGLFTEFKVEWQRIKQGCRGKGVEAQQQAWIVHKEAYLLKVLQFEADGISKARVEAKDPLARLKSLAKRVPADREADRETILQWVLNHMGTGAHSIEVDKIPCRGAVILLAEVEGDKTLRREMMREFLSSTKNKVVTKDVSKGRDKSLRDSLGRIPLEARPAGASDAERECQVPPVDSR